MRRCIFILIGFILLFSSSSFAQDNEENRLISISPAENSILDGFLKGDSILFTTSFDSICGGFHERIIEDDTKNIIYDAFNSVKSDNGEWVLKLYEDVVLQKGHTYTLEIEGHEDADSKSNVTGKVTISYIGNGQNTEEGEDDYEYSNIKYMRFSPYEGSGFYDVNFNFVIAVFSGDVTIDDERSSIIDEDGNKYAFQNFIPVNKNHDQWQMFIPSEILLRSTSHVTLQVYAKDMAGRAVKGNCGKGDNSYYELKYKCEFGYPNLSVSPTQGRYKSLEKFKFSNKVGIAINDAEGTIELKSSDGEIARSFIAGEMDFDPSTNSYVYVLEEPLEEIGEYTLVIPAGVFSIGNKLLDNKEMTVAYEISDKLKSYGVKEMEPADGSEVLSLSEVQITFDQKITPFFFNEERIYVSNEQGDSIITYGFVSYNGNVDTNKCTIKLDTPVSEPGEYHLIIPQKTFYMGELASIESQEMIFDYTVLGQPDKAYDVSILTIADNDETLKQLILKFNEFYWVGIVDNEHKVGYEVVLTDTLNNEVASAYLRLGVTNNELQVDSILPQLSKGKYLLHVPKDILIFNDTIYTKELVLEIDFDPTTRVILPAYTHRNNKTRVYNLQGMLIREGKTDEVLNGLKGIFIINGKKIVLQ